MEVRRLLTTLRSTNGEQEEVELVPIVAGALNEFTINEAAAGWVLKSTTAALDEERLHDALVDDDKGDLGLLSRLVVDRLTSFNELPNFTVDYLIALSSTDTVAEDDDVGGVHASVSCGKHINRLLEAVFKLRVDDFLSFLLYEEVREVLGHLFVSRCSETDDGVGTSMADIDANKHRPLIRHLVREFQVVEVSTCFRVNLLEDIAGNRKVAALGPADPLGYDHLRRDLILLVQQFVLVIELFVAND